MEIWKEIDGFDGFYLVSSLGNIKSIDRDVLVFRKGSYHYKKIKGCKIKHYINKFGYCFVCLYYKEKTNTYTVHSLVAKTFLGCAEGKEVNHVNGVKDDNRIENLEWVTRSENQRHAHANGLKNFSINGNPRRIVIDLNTGCFWSVKEAAVLLGKSISYTSAMLNGLKNNKTSLRYA